MDIPAIWMELPDHVIVGQAVLAPDDNHRAVVRVLQKAIVNSTRRRAQTLPMPSASPTTTSPTKCAPRSPEPSPSPSRRPPPELDELFQILVALMPRPTRTNPSYFAYGRVSADARRVTVHRKRLPLFAITRRYSRCCWSLCLRRPADRRRREVSACRRCAR